MAFDTVRFDVLYQSVFFFLLPPTVCQTIKDREPQTEFQAEYEANEQQC